MKGGGGSSLCLRHYWRRDDGAAQQLKMEAQLGRHGFASFVRKQLIFFRGIRHLLGNPRCHLLILFKAPMSELRQDTLLHMAKLQWQEGDKVIYQVLLDEAAVPKATWARKKKNSQYCRHLHCTGASAELCARVM